nr:unnamed protein product [Digitaria exilis]
MPSPPLPTSPTHLPPSARDPTLPNYSGDRPRRRPFPTTVLHRPAGGAIAAPALATTAGTEYGDRLTSAYAADTQQRFSACSAAPLFLLGLLAACCAASAQPPSAGPPACRWPPCRDATCAFEQDHRCQPPRPTSCGADPPPRREADRRCDSPAEVPSRRRLAAARPGVRFASSRGGWEERPR